MTMKTGAGPLLVAGLLLFAWPAQSVANDEAEVRAVVAKWYEEVTKPGDHRIWTLLAPGAITDWPKYCPPKNVPLPANYVAPPPFELAALALKFSYEIRDLTLDANFARADVWERGWFYAASAQTTYENAASTTFVLQRNEKGAWLILAHAPRHSAVHPDHINDPMPDMKPAYDRLMQGQP